MRNYNKHLEESITNVFPQMNEEDIKDIHQMIDPPNFLKEPNEVERLEKATDQDLFNETKGTNFDIIHGPDNSKELKAKTPHSCVTTNPLEQKKISEGYINYLECIKNNWSSSQASKLLNACLIKHISERFLYMSSSLKVRVLTSLFYLPDRLRIETKSYLLQIASNGEIDGNGWVKKFSRILKPYINTGVLDVNEIDSQTMHRILTFIEQSEHGNSEEENDVDTRTSSETQEYRSLRNQQELEYVHICDPAKELQQIESKVVIHLDEYTMFTPSRNFDELLYSVMKKVMKECKK